ncbi:MAG: 3-dehydroquinate synthase [Kiritimatiellae bacterium]|nr:3-dehydroquinate synthase [Kiritimatiellia bacterium]
MLIERTVELGARAYPVWIGDGAYGAMAGLLEGKRGVVVTDRKVLEAQGGRLAELGVEGWPRWVLEGGEGSKAWGEVGELLEFCAEAGLDRGSWLVAFGGGVVGDVTGFAAACWMRGVQFVQVPTTLLAMVDSSVGGKTGVNLRAGKNLAGAFWQPQAVAADPAVLGSLVEREYRSGLAEAVKMALGLDAGFFSWLEGHAEEVAAREAGAVAHVVSESVRLKAGVVAEDERERCGRRALLNLGHTVGHGLEAGSGYALAHGEAVALGLLPVLELSVERCGMPREEAERARALLERLHLVEARVPAGTRGAAVWEAMRRDKKSAGGEVRYVLLRGIGEALAPAAVEGAGEKWVEGWVERLSAGEGA